MPTWEHTFGAMQYYKLDENRIPRPVSFEEYREILHAERQEEIKTGLRSQRRRVAWDEIGDYQISTVFLDLDHRFWSGGDPIVFETMIFGPTDPPDQLQWRYTSYDAALEGHHKAVTYVERFLHAKELGIPPPLPPEIHSQTTEPSFDSELDAILEAFPVQEPWVLEQNALPLLELAEGGPEGDEDSALPDGPYPQG